MAITGIGTSQDYGAGAIHTFTAPYSGLYKFECWGAQGESFEDYAAGYGGYVYGHKIMNAGDKLYICVGTQAGYNGGGKAGYNGSGTKINGGNGGGATCVSTGNNGTSSNSLLIAGGGGGAGEKGTGGHGGGVSGLNGQVGSKTTHYADTYTASTSTTPGGVYSSTWSVIASSYVGMSGGIQSNGAALGYCGGGGGGYYGGATNTNCGGGGGSAYVAGMPMVSFNGKTYSNGCGGSRNGNGLARVTLIDISSNLYYNGTRITTINYNGTEVGKVIYNNTIILG